LLTKKCSYKKIFTAKLIEKIIQEKLASVSPAELQRSMNDVLPYKLDMPVSPRKSFPEHPLIKYSQ
jgi:hypothetical protein